MSDGLSKTQFPADRLTQAELLRLARDEVEVGKRLTARGNFRGAIDAYDRAARLYEKARTHV